MSSDQQNESRISDGSVTSTTFYQPTGTSTDGSLPSRARLPPMSALEREQALQRANTLTTTSSLYRSPASIGEPLSVKEVTTRVCDPRELSTRVKRLKTEYELMATDAPPCCCASPKGDDLNEWVATIQGPEGTVYEGGTFFLDVSFPKDFPYVPPKVRFTTRIYHCNINSQGVICLDILQLNWSPALTLAKVLLSISSLLCDCNPQDPLVGSVAKLYLSDKEEHDRTARTWTAKYAT